MTVIVSAQAPSQPPAPTASPERKQQQSLGTREAQDASGQQTPTAPDIPRVNESIAQRDDGKSHKQSDEAERKTSQEWWWTFGPSIASALAALFSAVFAAAILWVYIGQWRTMHQQAEYMRDGLASTKEAAEAAKTSADAAKDNIELAKVQLRPYVEVKWCKLIEGTTYPGQLGVQLGIVNNGGTPAGITMIETNYDIPDYRVPRRGTTRTSTEGTILSEVFSGIDGTAYIEIERADAPSGSFYMQVYGRIAYMNRVDKKTETFDFGWGIARKKDGSVTYQRSDGMREGLEWARADQQARASTAGSPIDLGGDTSSTIRSSGEQKTEKN